MTACDRLREKRPAAVDVFTVRVGHRALAHFGGPRVKREPPVEAARVGR